MAKQFSFGNIDEGNTDGFDLADMLEKFEAALNSMHEGDTEPAYKITGMQWRDTSGTPHLIKMWTGGVWLTIGSLNTATGIFTPYFQGAIQTIISTLAIGQGLENSSGSLRVKLKNASIGRDNDGLFLPPTGIVAGAYTNPDITLDEYGRVTAVTNGVAAVQPVTPGGEYVNWLSTLYQTSSSSWSLVNRVFVRRPGVVRIGFTMRSDIYTDSASRGQINISGNGVYTVDRYGNSSKSAASYYTDQPVNVGDYIDFYLKTTKEKRQLIYQSESRPVMTGNMWNMYVAVAENDVPAWVGQPF